ncbi:DUF6443 domain-containing protein [Pedobacter sp. ASV28]|uniref:DUF6443 domain-containing protein n=1 Tax=Pedobacter sp. ASV28 TaxID=2795123 RepID=UPI001E5C4AFC|nr:DUF6443 domain-containing protein [Pedobacter sp. ASV28]
MKKHLHFLTLLVFPLAALAQSTNQNYVKTTIYKQPVQAPIANPSPMEASQTVGYLDGLGRPIQKIARYGSSEGASMVTHMQYDELGRQPLQFLPYPSTDNSLDFQTSAPFDQMSFYAHFREGTQNGFSQTEYDGSPLNRIISQAAPGDPWAMGQNHEIRFSYQTNAGSDHVLIFSANAQWNATDRRFDISLLDDGSAEYGKNLLYKSITRDENWDATNDPDHSTEEYRDKEGRVILRRTFESGIAHNTYYVYDQYGNLTYVIPPAADEPQSLVQRNELCYQYVYDRRNRLIEKKLPGKQWEFVVYDKLDRPVAMGPVFSPFDDSKGTEGWIITKYDKFDRVLITAWLSRDANDKTRAELQMDFDSSTILSETKMGNSGSTVFDYYSQSIMPAWRLEPLTLQYYDDYDFPGGPTSFANVLSDGSQAIYYNQTRKPRSLNTGSWVRVLQNSTDYLADISYRQYDDQARVVAEYTANYLGGFTRRHFGIDFSGKTLVGETLHKRTANVTDRFIKETFVYDAQDRLRTHVHQIGSGTPQLIALNRYDEVGALLNKSVGGDSASGLDRLQQIDYSYNIRGWLTAINPDIDCYRCVNDDLFGFNLRYQDPDNLHGDVLPLYNGNISETYWKGSGSPVWRKYGYVYDALNRLTTAHYQKVVETMPNGNYDESLTYDRNGNILTLQRYGDIDAANLPIQIDDLAYRYVPGSNKLMDITDFSANPSGFSDEGDSQTDDYEYDDNGNMSRDANKGIDRIFYNHLNLPTQVDFSNNNKILYTYDALGSKVAKKIVTPAATMTVDYLDGFQYKNNNLEFFPHAEGYVRNTIIYGLDNFNYVFQYKDHLGDIRMNFARDPDDGTTKVLEESHYYPFGLKHANYSTDRRDFREVQAAVVLRPGNPINDKVPLDYNYRYNGKEWQDELGLNMYTYGFRDYDPAIGRWTCIDPLSEKSRRWSPYNYCVDNPVRFIDPDGREILNVQGGVKYTGNDALLAFGAIKKQIQSNGGIKGIHFVREAKTPNIYRHTLNSFRNGKPNVLHYDADKKNSDERRDDALKNFPSRYSEGLQRDEYPYASTTEGGAGADVAYVPGKENSSQGGSLSALYKTLNSGDAFLVLAVPRDKEPDAVPDPVPVYRRIPVPSAETMNKTVKPAATTATVLLVITMILLSPVGI